MKSKKLYCSHCKKKDGPFVKYSTNAYGHVYYHCRTCNTERLRTYRKTKTGKLSIANTQKRQTKKFPEKLAARSILNYALRLGKIKRPVKCSDCRKRKRLDAHHSNYKFPLRVSWFCRACHISRHRCAVASR